MLGRLGSVLVPVKHARFAAAVLFVGALLVPWFAAWKGLVKYDAAAASPNAARTIRLRPELVELPGGTFLMGSPETEKDREKDETQHSVTVAPFAMFRTEVTLGQWEAVMGTRPNDCEYGCDDNHPVQKGGIRSEAFTKSGKVAMIELECQRCRRSRAASQS